MKRLVCALIAALLLTTPAHAAEPPLADLLPEGLAEAMQGDVLAGGVTWLTDTARGALRDMLRDAVRGAALLVLVAVICGAAEGLGADDMAARYVPCCAVLAATALSAGDLKSLIGLGARTVDELGTLAKLLLPTLSAAMAAGGLVSTASVWQVTTLMVCDLLGDLTVRLLLPLVYCHIAAAAVGAMLDESRLGTLAEGIEKLVTGALTALAAAFTAYLTLAGVLTGSADRTAVRLAKVTVSGAVPIVGGVLSDAAESVLAAAGTLRGTVGAAGVFAIGAVCLVPLLRLGLQFLLYRLAAFAAGLVGSKALGAYLDRLGGAFALVFAMTAESALLLLVALLVATSMAAA